MQNPTRVLRRAAARAHVAWIYGIAAATLRASHRRALVLRYHAIGAPEEVARYASPGISVTPERFERQVAFLARRFDVVDLDTALARAREGGRRGARPAVVITFDDGYRDNAVHAVPILARHGVTATFYVVAGSVWPEAPLWTVRLRAALDGGTAAPSRPCPVPVPIDLATPAAAQRSVRAVTRWLRGRPAQERERALVDLAAWTGRSQDPGRRIMVDATELRGMREAGMTIAAHTLTHPFLPEIPPSEARWELVESRAVLERLVERPVEHMSYPNPGAGAQHDAGVRALAREAGYRTAATSDGGLVGPGADPFALPRFGVTPGFQERLLFRCLGETSAHV
ncbi:MAG TPA: polysaccharide deacetylase family protein [Candidatus Polarisedimenticolaceae bacterium]|nr:polysaccharide deacetylase family protein [Candidatus Polarisedimenticolaceae bacterium]